MYGTYAATPTTIREISVRYSGPRRKVSIREPRDVWKFFLSVVGEGSAKEHFLALYLNGRHEPCGYSTVSIGTATAALVHPREVFQPAVAQGACAMVIGHCHPSGDPEPSPEDREITRRLKKAGEVLGIPILDHVVFTDDAFVSLKERGLLSE